MQSFSLVALASCTCSNKVTNDAAVVFEVEFSAKSLQRLLDPLMGSRMCQLEHILEDR